MLSTRSLLVRTAGTIALALVVVILISLGAAAYFVAMPIAKRSADDLAALMVITAENWRESSAAEQSRLRQELLQVHGLVVADQMPVLPEKQIRLPYLYYLHDALARHAGEEIAILNKPGGKELWVDIPVEGSIIRLGFDPERISARPPTVLFLVIGGAIVLTLLTSIAIVRRVIGPLDLLYAAVREVSQGNWPPPLAENGPEELATVARAFNCMSSELQVLMENRTVMVAGISHDLRTPLTRLGLAVEMLDEDSDPQLVADIRRDLAAMETLIRQFMQLAQGLDDEQVEELDLWELLKTHVADLQRQGQQVELSGDGHCRYLGNPLALDRILGNLLDNAAHYGGGKPIEVELRSAAQLVSIRVRDRGPGIPEEQREAVFRPFYRLETARSEHTGGSGLGLAIASQLANKNGWTIELAPRSGGGTVAKLDLPTAGKT
jgi:two-component system osmolarity sensor histidine kinase EnvZ